MTDHEDVLSLPDTTPSLWPRLRQWTVVRVVVHAVLLILVLVPPRS